MAGLMVDLHIAALAEVSAQILRRSDATPPSGRA
jgi:hypothetical protein